MTSPDPAYALGLAGGPVRMLVTAATEHDFVAAQLRDGEIAVSVTLGPDGRPTTMTMPAVGDLPPA